MQLRCFDHLRKDKRFNELAKNLSGTIVIDASEAAEYYFNSKKEEWSFDDFVSLAPLYDKFWLDFTVQTINTYFEFAKDKPEQWGVYCIYKDATIENIEADRKRSPQLWSGLHDYMCTLVQHEQICWYTDFLLFWRRKNENLGPMWLWRIFLDKDGNVVIHDGNILVLEGPLHKDVVQTIKDYIAKGEPKEEVEHVFHEVFLIFLHTACVSISFLQCKNIITEHIVPPKRSHLTNAQKRRGESIVPYVEYELLHITPIIKKQRKTNNEENKSKRALHNVIGHFHTYTEDAPLFGNPNLVGRFFIPSHARGSLEEGIIVKDYKVKGVK